MLNSPDTIKVVTYLQTREPPRPPPGQGNKKTVLLYFRPTFKTPPLKNAPSGPFKNAPLKKTPPPLIEICNAI